MNNQQETAHATNNADIQLQMSDLISVLEFTQLASSRGAFRPEEFTTIGGVYERIFAFLESAGAVKRNDPPQQ